MKKRTLSMIAAAAIGLTACTTDPYTGESKLSNTVGGAGIGAGVGALGGALIGAATGGNAGRGALIGAGIGAIGGAGIGAYMDRQEDELRAELRGTGVSVSRVGDRIVLNMPSNITFATDQDQIRSDFYPTLNSVALVLRKYDRSLVDVDGHTDSQGSEAYNQDLSERRAASVADYLSAQGIAQNRLGVAGFGESRPIASNDTEAGRAENRRVEISIVPMERG